MIRGLPRTMVGPVPLPRLLHRGQEARWIHPVNPSPVLIVKRNGGWHPAHSQENYNARTVGGRLPFPPRLRASHREDNPPQHRILVVARNPLTHPTLHRQPGNPLLRNSLLSRKGPSIHPLVLPQGTHPRERTYLQVGQRRFLNRRTSGIAPCHHRPHPWRRQTAHLNQARHSCHLLLQKWQQNPHEAGP